MNELLLQEWRHSLIELIYARPMSDGGELATVEQVDTIVNHPECPSKYLQMVIPKMYDNGSWQAMPHTHLDKCS